MMYIFHPSINITSVANIFAWFQLDVYIINFVLWKQIKLEFHFISCKINDGWFVLTEIHRYHRISNRSNELSFVIYYFIIVHKKPPWRKSACRQFLIKCGILLNISLWISPFLIVCWLGKSNMRIIFIYHAWTVHNHRWSPFFFISCTCMPTVYYV